MTDVNHRRGVRSSRNHRGCRGSWAALPVGEAKFWQRRAHSRRRMLVRKLLSAEKADAIPDNTPKHVRWDYW